MKEHSDAAFSILDIGSPPQSTGEVPAYYADLNLETVLDRLADKGGGAVREMYRRLPETREDTARRRAVYQDVKREEVYRALTAFSDRAAKAADLKRQMSRTGDSLQRAVWQIRAADRYCANVSALSEDLEGADLSSEGLRRFREILKEKTRSGAFREMRERAAGAMDRLLHLRLVITCEKDRIRVEPGEAAERYDPFPSRDDRPMPNPFGTAPELTELERACLAVAEKRMPDLFREIRDTAGLCARYADPVTERFTGEIAFYLSFAALQRDMEARGCRFAVPVMSDGCPFKARGLYDLALACVFLPKGKRVVANDFDYGEGERFFVLNGPNQGGKTTFARSLGQLVYFAHLGLDVPAEEAQVPFFGDLQSHFSVEESVETGRGKLKEELVRLAPMMAADRRGTFIVINELFTTAAGGDARAMGQRVLEHFIALGCMGIYVTHLKGLSVPGTCPLHAALDEERRPTYQILRGTAPDLPAAEERVKKYHLTYEQLKERL